MMSVDLPPIHTLFLYILCFEIICTNSRTSTMWKLNSDQTKIIEASSFHQMPQYGAQFVTDDDPIFNIITSTVHLGESWVKERFEHYCSNCPNVNTKLNKTVAINQEEVLDCGKPVNSTIYDSLVGISNRNRYPITMNKLGTFTFVHNKQSKIHVQDIDVDALERKLLKAKREKPKSVQLYNQIGNFWRIKGDAGKAIECFRRALAVSPHNAEVLLNLARLLFSLQYLDDAIVLTKRSLEVQPTDKEAWQQYFTLGEILKAYGHYQEASIHLKHTLELKPGFEPAHLALREIENLPVPNMHIYTLLIILCLVVGVLLVILSSVENSTAEADLKPQRHFNKAMAMRSLRGFGMKNSRSKKAMANNG